jgi:3'-phosphoadenosine 5'-phosphosulfate sulfotransferase (PAPS reductase)/FAD synthetase
MSEIVKILSLGGGLDSFAMLLDAIQRQELPDLVIFADVGDRERLDPGEWPGTYRHVEEVVAPLCEEHGIDFKWLHTDESPVRGERSLFRYFEVKRCMPSFGMSMCTCAAKVERIHGYVLERYPDQDIEMWVGFEANERARAEKSAHSKSKDGRITKRHPLIESDLCRCRCEQLVRESGHPIPKKSACVFCAKGSRRDFQTLARELPSVFDRVCTMEENCLPTRKAGKIMRYGYKHGDGTDPTLSEWVKPTFKPRKIGCEVCGAEVRATKATGCDWLETPEPPKPPVIHTAKWEPPADDAKVVVNWGLGLDSTAILVRMHELGIRPDAIIFSDPGDEWPESYAYRDDVFIPWLRKVGFPEPVLTSRQTCGINVRIPETLYQYSTRTETLPSCAYGRKSCSLKFKAEAMNAYWRHTEWCEREWTDGRRIVKIIGYEAGEPTRYRNFAEFKNPREQREFVPFYPLVEWGLFRADLPEILERNGLPAPRKSACWYCPNNTDAEWRELRDKHPMLFQAALKLERICAPKIKPTSPTPPTSTPRA